MNKVLKIMIVSLMGVYLVACNHIYESEQGYINSIKKDIVKEFINDELIYLSNDKNIICIIDSEVNYDNPYLKGLFINETLELNNNIMTHATSIIGTICTNNIDNTYISILKNAKFYHIQVNERKFDTQRTIEELKKAEKMGAKVVNCSFVTSNFDEELYEFIKESNMLFICAVGNNNRDEILYPARYELDNVIAVVGVSRDGFCSKYSNYSEKAHIAALGEDILCITNKEGKYELKSGSSYATAFITAACAYIYNRTGGTALEVKEILLSTSNKTSNLLGYVEDGRILSMENIIQCLEVE